MKTINTIINQSETLRYKIMFNRVLFSRHRKILSFLEETETRYLNNIDTYLKNKLGINRTKLGWNEIEEVNNIPFEKSVYAK